MESLGTKLVLVRVCSELYTLQHCTKLCVNPSVVELESLFYVHASCCWGTRGSLAPSDVLELPRTDAHQQMDSDCTALCHFFTSSLLYHSSLVLQAAVLLGYQTFLHDLCNTVKYFG